MSPVLVGVVALVVIGVAFLARPRRFYFVRHGETMLNVERIKQGAEGGLSERGERQAERVGEGLQHLSIARIIASPYPRARETAMILEKYLKVPVIYSPLMVERRNPRDIIGKSTRDPEVMRIVDQIDLAYHEDDYRFSDEENFIELKERARRCLNLLARQGARNTCIVTHHVFLKILLAYLLYRERLHSADFAKLSFFNVSDNAGITVCEFRPWRVFSRTRGWSVVSYNEQLLD